METLIKNDLPILIVIVIVIDAIALIVFLIWRNQKDKNPLNMMQVKNFNKLKKRK